MMNSHSIQEDLSSFLQKKELELPHLLLDPKCCAIEKKASSLILDQKSASFFQHLEKEHVYSFVKKQPLSSPLNVGVLFSGGQAPGGHNVIAGLVYALENIHPKSCLYGFFGGPAGLCEGRYAQIDSNVVKNYLNQGGFDLIGSGRTKIEREGQLRQALHHCRDLDLDGLVVIGGDDSNTNAAVLAEFFEKEGVKTQVIGVPKTIDGDLKNAYVEQSFGFDTACRVYSEMIGNLCRDALSAKKYTHFVRLMGRSASHIALECALQTQPNLTLIGEEIAEQKIPFAHLVGQVADHIAHRAHAGKTFGVILIPEGLIEFIPEFQELIKELNQQIAKGEKQPEERLSKNSKKLFEWLPQFAQKQLLLQRDSHGNVQVSHIETEKLLITLVDQQLKKRKIPFKPVSHFLGYEGRCSFPSLFDAHYCYALGVTAAVLVKEKASGFMACIKNLSSSINEWEPMGIPIAALTHMEERQGELKPVIRKALVDINGVIFEAFKESRASWEQEDLYCFPGPIQFFGPKELCFQTSLSLQIESKKLGIKTL